MHVRGGWHVLNQRVASLREVNLRGGKISKKEKKGGCVKSVWCDIVMRPFGIAR